MKKVLAITMVLLMTLALVACSSASVNEQEVAVKEQDTEVEEQEVVSTDEPTATESPDESEPPEETTEMFAQKASIEETVLVDESDVKIIATEISYDSWQPEIKITIENNSDKNLSIYAGTAGYSRNSVNGYMINSGYLNVNVEAGKKAKESISLNPDELALLGITEIADVELGFEINDDNYDEYLKTGPIQLKTSITDTYDYATNSYQSAINSSIIADEFDFSIGYFSNELVDDNDVRIISEAISIKTDETKAIFFEVENNSSEQAIAEFTDLYINGLMISSGSLEIESINPGRSCVVVIPIDESYADIFGITEIGDVSLSFSVRDVDYNEVYELKDLNITLSDKDLAFNTSGEELYNQNGIQFINKGIVPDQSEYSDDIHILLLVENNYTEVISIGVAYDSVYVNDFATRDYFYSTYIDVGKSAIIDVALYGSSLEENGFTSITDIINVDMTFEVKTEDYDTIDEPVISISYE